MSTLSKRDRQGVRTPADVERKYNLGKTVAEVKQYAAEARRAAEDANNADAAIAALDKKLDQTELMHRIGMVDYVAETGTAEYSAPMTDGTAGLVEWTYEKWNSGIVKLWGRIITRPQTTGNVSLYAPYPFKFYDYPTVTVDGGRNASLFSRVRFGDSASNAPNNQTQLNLTFENISRTGYDIEAFVQVIGRWK